MQINYAKYTNGLVPAIIQDAITGKVLMLGFMNQLAVDTTIASKKVTFYSRTKQRLWTKGEQSGHYLQMQNMAIDCDNDTLLIKAIPNGPTCHTGTATCWGETNNEHNFLQQLQQIIADRKNNPLQTSYVSNLFAKGINKIAQKVGEEAVELVIESKDDNEDLFINEAADLLFHFLILLQAKNTSFNQVLEVLQKRHNQ
jgi:phosphoribosyl-AMP cyclohydrolase / phosphoribosyl-ATP pyrophosphohydrolase